MCDSFRIIQGILLSLQLFFAARTCVCGSSFNHSSLYVKGESFQLYVSIRMYVPSRVLVDVMILRIAKC